MKKFRGAVTFALALLLFGSPVLAMPHGIYALMKQGATSIPAPILSDSSVDGISIRDAWGTLEPSEDTYDFSNIDSLVAAASAAGKQVSISIMAGYTTPAWVYADGAQPFSFIWAKPWGATLCSVQNTPVPYDPVFLAKFGTFIAALGQHYGANPTVSMFKLNGINYQSEETSLPNSSGGIDNGCVTNNDVANWQAIGYTRAQMEAAWDTIAQDWGSAFTIPLAGMFNPTGFPSQSGTGLDKQATLDLLAMGYTTLPGQFIGQNNALSPSFVWPALNSAVGPIGFQAVGPWGSATATQQALSAAIADGALYVEVYIEDLEDSTQASVIQQAHDELTGAAPTPSPSSTPTSTPTATPKPTASATPRPTPSPKASPTPQPTPSPTASPTPDPTPSPTASPTPDPTPSPTASTSPQPTPTSTASSTPHPTLTPTPDPTATPSPDPTPSPTASPSPTPQPTPKATSTPRHHRRNHGT